MRPSFKTVLIMWLAWMAILTVLAIRAYSAEAPTKAPTRDELLMRKGANIHAIEVIQKKAQVDIQTHQNYIKELDVEIDKIDKEKSKPH